MNIEYKEKFSCSINEHFSVKAQRILIKLACIDGYGNGDKYSSLITPAQSCFVVKDKGVYRVINAKNPRVNALLLAFNSESKVECLLIDKKREDVVSFLENELLLQQSSSVTFKTFIQNLATSIQKQKFILSFFCSEPSRKDATFLFNISTFLGLMGANTPSKQSVLNYLNPAKIKKEKVITPPTQLKKTSTFKSRDFTNTITKNKVNLEPKTSNIKKENNFNLSSELKLIWVNFVESDYSIDDVISRLRQENTYIQEAFVRRLKLDKDSPEFKEFISKFIEFMNTKKHD